jgi:hypothetical protein
MKNLQNSRDAATPAPAPPTKNPSPVLRVHAAPPAATRSIHPTAAAWASSSAELRMKFLINGQIIRIRRNPLKTNNSTRF